MKRTHVLAIACTLLPTFSGYGQSTLTKVFQDLHSADEKVRTAATKNIVDVFLNEIPTINTETNTICTALDDKDWYIRMQASGILSTLVALHPEDAAVVDACTPELIHTAFDTTDQVKLNSLHALANKVGGPPADAEPAFMAALISPNVYVKQLGATGVMNLPPSAAGPGKQFIIDTLTHEQDEEVGKALLYGVAQSRKQDLEIAQAASRLLQNSSPETQSIAIAAVESLNSDKAKALAALQNAQSSSKNSPETKQRLNEAVQRLQAQSN